MTTLLDARRYPADRLVHLYHERWEHDESAYYALRHTILHGRVLRSHDPAGVEQEVWAVLTLYQRRTMVQAADSRAGTDPDRCGFAVALQTARDLLVGAEEVFEQGIGEIGRRVLSALSPARRGRVSTRKCAVRFRARLAERGMERVVFDRLLDHCKEAGLVAAGESVRAALECSGCSVGLSLGRTDVPGSMPEVAKEARPNIRPSPLFREWRPGSGLLGHELLHAQVGE